MVAPGCRALLVAVLLCASLPAPAATDEAERLFEQARRQYTGAEFEEAIRLLTRARAAAPRPPLRAQIEIHLAANYDVLGRPADARAALRAALELDPSVELDARRFRASLVGLFRELREGLKGRLEVRCEGRPCGTVSVDGVDLGRGPAWNLELLIGARRLEARSLDGQLRFSKPLVIYPGRALRVVVSFPPPRGTLSVRSTPSGAIVLLDGQAIGETPLSRRTIAVGAHRVTLRREGHVERTLPVEIADGTERQLDVWLAAVSREAPAPRRRRWTWVAGGLGLAALGAGVALGVAARSDHRRWEELRVAGLDPVAWEDLRSAGQRKQLAANLLRASGGVLAATGVVLFVLEGRRGRGAVRKLELATRGAGLAVGGSF